MITQTSLRIDSDLYKQLKVEAVLSDISTNELICQILQKFIEQKREDL